MRRLFVFLVPAFIVPMSGCYTLRQGENVQKYTTIQQSVFVRVVNNCAPSLVIEGMGGVIKSNLGYGESFTVVLVRQPFSSSELTLTVKGSASGRYLGSATKTYYVNYDQGARQEVWEVNYLNLPGGSGGCLGR